MLRTGLILSSLLVAALAPLLTGCPGFCGAAQGGGDRIYQRGSDELILCMNEAFYAQVGGTTIEGYFTYDSGDGSQAASGVEGDTGMHSFDLYDDTDGSVSIPAYGSGEWQELTPDAAELDHYDWYCQQVVMQSWWTNHQLGA